MLSTMLATIGAVGVTLTAATRIPVAGTTFLKSLVPLVRAAHALRAECRPRKRPTQQNTIEPDTNDAPEAQ